MMAECSQKIKSSYKKPPKNAFLNYEMNTVVLNDKESKSDDDNKKIEELINEFAGLNEILNSIDSYVNSIFSNSAEVSSENRQSTYFCLFLTYINVNGKDKVLIEGETLEEKLRSCDAILDDESESSKQKVELYKNALMRSGFLISSWMMGKAVNESDFKLLYDQMWPAEKPKEVEVVETTKVTDSI